MAKNDILKMDIHSKIYRVYVEFFFKFSKTFW